MTHSGITRPAPDAPGGRVVCANCGHAYLPVMGPAGELAGCPVCVPTLVSRSGSTRPGSSPPGPGAEPEGHPFGRYRLIAELGRGGMGVVWKAWDTELRRVVALKQILGGEAALDAGLVERFQREARSAARLRHPGIVPVYDVGVHEGVHFFTSEFVEGRPLSVLAGKPLAPSRAVSIVRAIADALQYAHEEGIVHRDVKPGNILLDGRGAPRILDFGLAKDTSGAARSNLTTSGSVFGTPRYMSPEQADGRTGEIGPAGDQFSLAVILYELLTGRVPFEAENLRVLLTKIAMADPVPPRRLNPGVPRELEAACLAALAKAPADRFPSMRDFSVAIERGLQGVSRSGRSRRRRRASGPPRRGPLLLVAGAAVLLLAVGAAAAIFFDSGPGEEEGAPPEGEEFPGLAAESETESSRALGPLRAELGAALVALEDASVPWEGVLERVAVAKRRIAELLAVAPDIAEGHHLLGLSRELLGEFPEAEASYRRAIEIDPSLHTARTRLARLLLARALLLLLDEDIPRSGRIDEARRRTGEARTELERSNASGEAGAAEREFAEAVWIYFSPRPIEGLAMARAGAEKRAGTGAAADFHWLAGVIAYPEPSVSLPSLDEAIRLRPRHRLAIFYRSMLRQERSEADAALADLDLAIRLGLALAPAHINRAVLRWQHAGDPSGAREDLDEAIRRSPRSFLAHKLRGAVRYQAGDIDGAIADLDVALEVFPERADALRDRGALRILSRDHEGALRDLDLAIRLEPGNAAALTDRGYARRLAGDLQGALADYDEAIRLDPSAPDAFLYRAYLRDDLGDTPGALADVEKALELAPADWGHREVAGTLRQSLRSRPK